jgi:hypothetical protein
MATKYIRKTAPESVISEENAQEMVGQILDYYDIDIDKLSGGSDLAAKILENSLDEVRDAFRSGRLELGRGKNESLTIIHHLKSGNKLEYQEINAAAKLATEAFSAGAKYSQVYAFMGSLAGVGKTGIEKLAPTDLALVEVIGTVFLNA